MAEIKSKNILLIYYLVMPHNLVLVSALTVAALGVPYMRANSPKLPPSSILEITSSFLRTSTLP